MAEQEVHAQLTSVGLIGFQYGESKGDFTRTYNFCGFYFHPGGLYCRHYVFYNIQVLSQSHLDVVKYTMAELEGHAQLIVNASLIGFQVRCLRRPQ